MPMNEGRLEEFLFDITMSALLRETGAVGTVSELLPLITMSVKSRRIVDCIQFEGLWEEAIDESHALFINLKLSPEVCEAGANEGIDFHELSWSLVLPEISSMDPEDRPESADDWLTMAEIDINLETDEIFDELTRLIVLDVEED